MNGTAILLAAIAAVVALIGVGVVGDLHTRDQRNACMVDMVRAGVEPAKAKEACK